MISLFLDEQTLSEKPIAKHNSLKNDGEALRTFKSATCACNTLSDGAQ